MPDDAKARDDFIPGHIDVDTLSGDMRDILLPYFRNARKPWPQMSADEQSMFNEGVDKACRDLVRQAVSALVAVDHAKCVVRIGDLKIIGGERSRIEAKITAPNIHEYREILGEAVGDQALLLMIDSDHFMGERAPAPVTPDQATLPIDPPDEAPFEDSEAPDDEDVPGDDPGLDDDDIPLSPADSAE